ncbi:hypothetical protein ACHAWF_016449 [Thalassiosira exigua]
MRGWTNRFDGQEPVSSSDGINKVRTSKFTLVDLAGSERQKSEATEAEQLKEASMINASLMCLGQVIIALKDRSVPSRGGEGGHKQVPFRDSKLASFLRDSAKLVKNAAKVNGDTCGSVAALKVDVARLRATLEQKEWEGRSSSSAGEGKGVAPGGEDSKLPASNRIVTAALCVQNVRLERRVRVLEGVADRRTKQRRRSSRSWRRRHYW